MNAIQLLNKIKGQLNDLSTITNQLLSENTSANAIEIALLKKQCVELYESISKLTADKVTAKHEEPEQVAVEKVEEVISQEKKEEPEPVAVEKIEVEIPQEEEEKQEPVVAEKIEVEIPQEQTPEPVAIEKVEIPQEKEPVVSMEEFEIKEASVIGNTEEHIPIQPANEIIKEVLEEVKEEPQKESFTEPVVEKKSNLINFPPTEPSLHQKIAENKQFDINERINDSKVESLKSAIGLNKKIAFVNELFKENTVDYAKAIEKLNTSVDLNEAMRFFNEFKHQYSWTNDNENVIELEQLIQKRFR